MNGRILELVKNPDLFQITDLELLTSEIDKHPYVQSLRALRLLGTHRLTPENYPNELSVTAAYTTDKKILYHLINAVEVNKIAVNTTEPMEDKEIIPEEPVNKFTEIESKVVETPKSVFVKGELNRILFEGEEDFLEREVELIDLESTLESGQIVTQKMTPVKTVEKSPVRSGVKDSETFKVSFNETEQISPEKKAESNVENADQEKTRPVADREKPESSAEINDIEGFSKETIITEEVIAKEASIIQDPSEVSFQEIEAFIPEEKAALNTDNSDQENSVELTSDEKAESSAEVNDDEGFSKETIIEEKAIVEEASKIADPSEVSFQEIEAFIPEEKADLRTDSSGQEKSLESAQQETIEPSSEVNATAGFSKETIIKEEVIAEEEPIIEDPSELSFHATAEFLPDVKIVPNIAKQTFKEAPKPALNKHELEMQKLIADVEAKMKASKSAKPKTQDNDDVLKSAEVNFSETQSFEIEKGQDTEEIETSPEKDAIVEPQIKERKEISGEKSLESNAESKKEFIKVESDSVVAGSNHDEKSGWKPMSFSSNSPESFRSKKVEQIPVKEKESKQEKTSSEEIIQTSELKAETSVAERPTFNASFFTQNVSALEKKQVETESPVVEEKAMEDPEDSNVPDFINTWQSWLKIDRNKIEAEEKIEISITEIKNKVIENFIEKEPRISKLKEESDFVIKERNDDISHLMTETLANLYTEQKLYAKAIKSYGLLSEKHPDKKAHFDSKIKQIKELRQNK